ncbi:hypothetical protein CVT25_000535 [Psilocybe cyanescens]|uniref:Wax synthase domain-containing protein n=1 Tax=Psilocybe cyanescens TaxID=93625 RepID=A0A409WZU5_PSICY|nr:hypothetical protein CVT25_000535 [Psilocybe cyanescens]
MLVACLPGHGRFTKAALLVSLTWISYYLITETNTGDPAADLGLGSALLTQLLTALDSMYFTDPNTLINYHEPHPGTITEKPLSQRIRWAFNLYTNNRGLGWAHEPSDLPEPYEPSTPRWKFVRVRLAVAGLSVLVECVAFITAVSNPAMNTPGQLVSESPFLWRALGVVSFGAAAAARINAASCAISAVVVGLGFSTPDRWPSLFGSPLEAWTVRRFWSMASDVKKAASHFILVEVLRLPPLSQKINNKVLRTIHTALFLNMAFLISGLVHIGGEYMFLGRMGYGAFKFFCLQGAGITLEIIVALAWSQLTQNDQHQNQMNPRKLNGKATNEANGSKATVNNKSKSKPKVWDMRPGSDPGGAQEHSDSGFG